MTAYFDLTTDKPLLPPALRGNAELANVAALAEAAVIGYYTSNPPYYLYTTFLTYTQGTVGSVGGLGLIQYVERGIGEDISALGQPSGSVVAQLRVYLAGFKADASSAQVDPNLKFALKRTIAEVIRWWLTGWGREPAVQSASDFQGKVRAYRANADDAFPPDWNRWLIPFDTRPLPWGF